MVNDSPRAIRLTAICGIVALSILLRWELRQTRIDLSFLLLWSAIAFVSMLGGFVSGLVATLLLTAMEWWLDRRGRDRDPRERGCEMATGGGLADEHHRRTGPSSAAKGARQ